MSEKSKSEIVEVNDKINIVNNLNYYFEKLYEYYFKHKNIIIYIKGKVSDIQDIFDIMIQNKLYLWNLFVVYVDLRNKGYKVSIGNFDNSLYIYSRYNKENIKQVVFVLDENQEIDFEKVNQFISVAKQYNAECLIALVDKYGDITYYNLKEVNLIKK